MRYKLKKEEVMDYFQLNEQEAKDVVRCWNNYRKPYLFIARSYSLTARYSNDLPYEIRKKILDLEYRFEKIKERISYFQRKYLRKYEEKYENKKELRETAKLDKKGFLLAVEYAFAKERIKLVHLPFGHHLRGRVTDEV